jgi:hypothetical protein
MPVSSLVTDVLAVADGGNRILYSTIGAMPGAPSGDLIAHNLASRTDSGWRTEGIGGHYSITQLSSATLLGPRLTSFASDLSSAIIYFAAPLLSEGPPEPRVGVYRWLDGGGLELLADAGEEGTVYASSDRTGVVFGSKEHLLPSDAGRSEGESIYQSRSGQLQQVDVATDGSLLSSCGSSVPPGGASGAERIYFLNPASEGCESPPRIFLREGDDTTTEVSQSRCTGEDCGPDERASVTGVTPSGSVAFFSTSQRLVNADQNTKRDLYRFDAATNAVELVSPGTSGMEGEVAEEAIHTSVDVHTSVDGERTYFYSQGRLLPGEGSETGANLYLASPGGLRFVAPVGPKDPLQISEDGRLAVVSTKARLSSLDEDESVDTYRYDAGRGEFTLLSHSNTGGDGAFDATIASPIQDPFDSFEHRAVSADGSRVFFSTAEQLLPEDENEALDVYEWNAGRLDLISSGTGTDPAKFAGSSADGGTVAFLTAASLLPSDRDGGDIDVYVARPGGGFPEGSPEAAECELCAADQAHRSHRTPESATAVAPGSGRIRLRRGRPAPRAGRRGRFLLEVVVPEPGRISIKGWRRIRGRRQLLLRGSGGAVAAGPARALCKLSPQARKLLARRRWLRLRLLVRQGTARLSRRITIESQR